MEKSKKIAAKVQRRMDAWKKCPKAQATDNRGARKRPGSQNSKKQG